MLITVLLKNANSGKSGNWETKKEYLTAKIEAKKTVFQANSEAEKNRLTDVPWRNNQKYKKFKIAKTMVKTNQDIIGE